MRFGPAQAVFYIFDYSQNLEFFAKNPNASEGSSNESLSKKLFAGRVELIGESDKRASAHVDAGVHSVALRGDTAERLRAEVSAMSLENFIVQPKRRYIERYSQAEAWEKLGWRSRRN